MHHPTLRRIAMWTLVAVSMFSLNETEAAYLRDVPQELIQPDGTPISCFASGDEYFNWLHDKDGFVIVRHPATGFWVWAAKEDGEIVPTEHIVNLASPQLLGLTPRIRPDSTHLKHRRQLLASPMPKLTTSSGTIQNLVIFIRFSDDAEFSDAVSSYSAYFNSTSPGSSSLKAYFREVSSGRLSINSNFYPTPPNNTVVSYRDSHPRSYYQPYDAVTNPNGYSGDSERETREHTLLRNAANAVSGQVSPSLDIDSDSDGYVDNVVFILKGGPDGWNDLLWPHQWVLYSQTAVINGAHVYDYNLQLSDYIGVGVLCHEMFHTLGAPDLYHYDESFRDLEPVGKWDVMEYDLEPPQHMLVYMKQRYGGWLQEIPEITATGTYTLASVATSPASAYRIASPYTRDEYFVVEYRRRHGAFESSLPGSGLIVYRVDTRFGGEGNGEGPPDEVYIYRPGGTPTNNGDVENANFSLYAGRTKIDDSTNPSSFLADGGPGGLVISNITGADDTITFTVTVSGDSPSCTYSISPNSRTYDSNAGSGTVSVTANSSCSWTAASNNSGWLTVTGGSSGSGNGTVSYSVASNSSTNSRNGTLTIAGRTFTVSQSGATPSCTYSISPTSRSFDSVGGSGTVSVTAGNGCSWTAGANNGWISVTGGSSGSGNGTVSYSVASNSTTSSRTGTMTIAGKTFTVSQSGASSPPPSGDSTHFAVIAHTTGAANSIWQSSLSITNISPDPTQATLTYRYKPDAWVIRNVTIPPFGLVEWADAAVDLFGLGGKTSGVVDIEANGSVLVAARTFNSSPAGTFGQSLPGATLSESLSYGEYGNINPVRQTQHFRTNIGVINTGTINCSVILYFVNAGGYIIGDVLGLNLAPGEWKQVNEALNAAGLSEADGAYAVLEVRTPGGRVWAYGTVIDNLSGDPTALQMTVEEQSGDSAHYAVIARTTGAANSVWQSSMSVCNTSPNPATATLTYQYRSDASVVRNVTIPPFGLVEWADAAVDLFGLGGKTSGVVRIQVNAPIQTAVRTFNSSPAGTFGQSLPGASQARSMTYGQYGIITPIRRTPNFRTNIGIINTGAASGSARVYFVRQDGYIVGQELNVNLAPGEWKQINDTLDAAGISELDGAYTVIELREPGTSIWAYGTVIDNLSGDPTALQMVIVE